MGSGNSAIEAVGVQLSNVEASELTQLEITIEKGIGEFVAVGRALLRIRDGKLYREGFKSFDTYCRERWSFGDRHAHRLMEGVDIVDRISADNKRETEKGSSGPEFSVLPESSRQTRALKKLPDAEQAAAFREAVASSPKRANGKPKTTARHVAKVVAKRVEEKVTTEPQKVATVTNEEEKAPEQEWPVDEVGQAVPDEFRPAFEARPSFDKALSLLSQVRATVNPLLGDADKVLPSAGGEHLAEQRADVLRDVKNLRATIRATKPHAICPYCKGSLKYLGKKCDGCKGLGWVCEHTYTSSPKEMQAKRK